MIPRLPIGHATSDSTVYNLLHRQGWRKLMPRPHHPTRDLAARNNFKKMAFLMLRGRPGGLLRCADDACAVRLTKRFGPTNRDGSSRHRWACGLTWPPNSSANTSIYMRCLSQGWLSCVYLVMPTSNTVCFQAFLDIVARRFARQDILPINGAQSPLRRPCRFNVTLLYLPSCKSPKFAKNIQKLCTQIHGRRVRQAQAGYPLHRTQIRARPLHDLLSLHRQLTLM